MGAALWANIISDGSLICDEYDKVFMYKKCSRLDKICASLDLPLLSSMLDHTDAEVNMEVRDMPDHMESTTELMVASGVWVEFDRAVGGLRTLLEHLQTERPRIGLISDRRAEIVEELQQCLDFAQVHAASGSKFNFAVVM